MIRVAGWCLGFVQLAMERELASMWELSFVVPPDHGALPLVSVLFHNFTIMDFLSIGVLSVLILFPCCFVPLLFFLTFFVCLLYHSDSHLFVRSLGQTCLIRLETEMSIYDTYCLHALL
jgi:hypothetical protein